MNWDGSRVAAAIPSGVGFLGAGIIWKQENKDGEGHTVSGLTTAASIWLSAAVGIACSGELYFAGTFSVAVMLLLLRFGPRTPPDDDSSYGALSGGAFDHEPAYHYDNIEARKTKEDELMGKYMNEYGSTALENGTVTPEELQALQPRNGMPSPRSPGSRHGRYDSSASLDVLGGQDISYRKRSKSVKKKKPSLME